MTAEDMMAAMEQAGVDAAIAVSPYITYGYDSSYAFDAAARYSQVFGVVSPFDPLPPDVEGRLAAWKMLPGALGIRLVLSSPTDRERLLGASYGALFRSADRAGIPVCISIPGGLPTVGQIARKHPSLQLVIDHLGMASQGDPTWKLLPELLALAEHPNVALKATAATVHSRQSYPFSDLWPSLHKVIDAFGVDRVMWGSDWTRVHNASYAESLQYVADSTQLSESDKEKILGANLRRIFKWQRASQPQT
jgi:L-fuconolactonase